MDEACPDCGSGMEYDPDAREYVCAACDSTELGKNGDGLEPWKDDEVTVYERVTEHVESEERGEPPPGREQGAGRGLPRWLRLPGVLYVAAAVVTIVYGLLYVGTTLLR